MASAQHAAVDMSLCEATDAAPVVLPPAIISGAEIADLEAKTDADFARIGAMVAQRSADVAEVRNRLATCEGALAESKLARSELQSSFQAALADLRREQQAQTIDTSALLSTFGSTANLQAERDRLAQELVAADQRLRASSQSLVDAKAWELAVQSQVETLTARLTGLQTKMSEAEASDAENQTRLATLRLSLDDARDTLAQSQKAVAALEVERDSLAVEVTNHQAQRIADTDRLNEALLAFEQTKQKLAEATAGQKAAQADLAVLKRQYEQAQTAHRTAFAQAGAERTKATESLKAEIAALEARTRALTADQDRLAQQSAAQQTLLAGEISSLKQTIAAARGLPKDLAASQVLNQRLVEDISELERRLERVAAAADTREYEVQNRQAEIDALRTTLAERDAALATTQALAAEAERQHELAQAEIERAQAIVLEHERAIAARLGEIGILTASIERLTHDLTVAKDRLAASQQSGKLLAARVVTLETQLAVATNDRNAVMLAADTVEQDLALALRRLDSLEDQLEQKEAAHLATLSEAASLSERMASLSAKFAADYEALQQAHDDLQPLMQRSETLFTTLAIRDGQLEQLQRALAQVKRAEADAALAARSAQQKLEAARAGIADDEAGIGGLIAENLELREQVGSAKAREAELVRHVRTLGERLRDSRQQIASLETENAGLRAALAEARRTVGSNEESVITAARSGFNASLMASDASEHLISREDRLALGSEFLFGSGSARLSKGGKTLLRSVAEAMKASADQLPEGLDWVVRVEGHADKTPIRRSRYRNNWELSIARAVSVVSFMQDDCEIPEVRLMAAGFGDTKPVNPGDAPEDLAENRRVELRLVER